MFLTGLDRVLRDAGVSFTGRSGWRTRTAHAGGLNEVRAVMWHTTESADSAFRNSAAPTLSYVTNGLGYNLYNILIGRDGRAHIIAAGTAGHAGQGSGHGMPTNNGNRYSIGISFDSNGGGTPVNAAQLEAGAAIGAAINREWNNNIRHVMHGEWAPSRRTDPTRVPGGWAALRSAIARGSWASSGSTPNPPSSGGSSMSWSNRDVDFVNNNATTARHQLGRIHENTQPSEQGRTSWRWWGLDYVNSDPISKDSQLARAHQYSRNASRLNDRRIDYVNDEGSETTARHQIARAHQYSMDARREAREANEKLDAMAEALGETLAAVVDESVRDAFAAKMSQIKDDVAQVNAADVAAELEVSAKETEAEEQEEEETE